MLSCIAVVLLRLEQRGRRLAVTGVLVSNVMVSAFKKGEDAEV